MYNRTMAGCRFCFHPQRDTIDRLYVKNTPLRTIIQSFGGSLGAAHRHKAHVTDLIRARTDGEREEHAGNLLARVQRLAGEAEGILATAKAAGNLKGATSAICAAVRVLELCGRLDGSLAQPNAGGLHLTLNSTKVTVNKFDGDDVEFAMMIGEATNGFDVAELLRLKRIAQTDEHLLPAHSVQPPCNGPSNSLNPQD